MLIGNVFFVFKYPVKCKQKFPILFFYWNLSNRSTLCAHPLMTRIIFHTRAPNIQENVSYVIYFYVSADIHFSNFVEMKSNFFILLQFALRIMY